MLESYQQTEYALTLVTLTHNISASTKAFEVCRVSHGCIMIKLHFLPYVFAQEKCVVGMSTNDIKCMLMQLVSLFSF